jgi:hypothetical protein
LVANPINQDYFFLLSEQLLSHLCHFLPASPIDPII